ncbi:TPA: type III secretion system effector cytotoxin ExoU [Pseudomonas aeruginosa]|nr:type III secretion system effector cytotoxin ExoU [Pseudomonas aeruginosa]
MHIQSLGATASSLNQEPVETPSQAAHKSASLRQEPSGQGLGVALKSTPGILSGKLPESVSDVRFSSPQGQGESRTLTDSAGPRQITLRQFENGVTELQLSRPPLTSLVLSGGGAKGAAYPGAMLALEEKGMLDGIRSMSGSSAGGITAALLASGMSPAAFKTLSDKMDLISLLDSSNKKLKLFQHISSEIGASLKKGLGNKIGGFSELLLNVLPRIDSRAEPLERLLRDETRKAVLGQIATHPEVARQPTVAAIASRLQSGSGVTFGDLDRLSAYIPQIKTLNITGTAMFEGRPQLVVFNASHTPDLEVAQAAHISGSFPGVFQKVSLSDQPYQAGVEWTEFQDGGVMINVPVPEMIDKHFDSGPLRRNDNLILEFEGEAGEVAPDRGTRGGALKGWLVGVPALQAREMLQLEGLEELREQTVVVPLKSERGDFSGMLGGTLNFTMPDEIKAHLQERLQERVGEHLEKRLQASERHTFASLDEALLALDDSMLTSVAQQNPEITDGAVAFRQKARDAFTELTVAIVSANGLAGRLKLDEAMRSALQRLDALADTPERLAWLAAELNHADNVDHQQLLDAMRGQTVQSPVLAAALAEAQRRKVAVIAENIRKEVIFPSLYRPGQPDSNVALLRRAEEQLRHATSPAEINQALNDIVDNYSARGFLRFGKPLSSTTVEMAKAWRNKEFT